MGAQHPLPTEVPIRQSPRTDGQGSGHRIPCYCNLPYQKGRTDSENSKNRCSHSHPTVWTVRRSGCIKPESERGPVHFHMLFLDGVYAKNKYEKEIFQQTNAPTQEALAKLVHTLSHRVARYLEPQGVLERDEEKTAACNWMAWMKIRCSSSLDARLAIGLRWGRNRGARCSLYKRCQRLKRMNDMHRWRKKLGSVYLQG